MSDESDSTIELNRRRVLAGLGTIGVASAGAGAGTFALFSDTEESTGNSVTAGTLNLTADGNDGSETTTLSVTGAAPGDTGIATTTLRNAGNISGFLNVDIDSVSSAENGLVEPERQAGDSSTGGSSGELADYLSLELDIGGNMFTSGLVSGMENVQFNPNEPISGSSVKDFNIQWEIDEAAGNVIQTDSVSVDFTLELLQEAQGKDVVLSGDTPYGQGAGFSNPWDTTGDSGTPDISVSGSGAWGTVDHSSSGTGNATGGEYKQGFYFAGDFSSISTLSGYTIDEITEISYSLYKDAPLAGNDIYLLIYTRPEGDGNDGASWYDSRLVALPSDANGAGSPNFTTGEWNTFSTRNGASNTLVFDDSGHKGGNSVGGPVLPTLSDLGSGPIDWTNYDSSLSSTFDYQNQEVKALSLQTNSTSPDLEAWIDDVTVKLATGEELSLDLEP
ncbi:TasA family protein [Halosegnis longus]|uniref:TasA family protein n=1 Tax=Halosegnis longus TaxID=2216012 RepID=UPI00129E5425|nr:TasA family protein [Halosegnis longus]